MKKITIAVSDEFFGRLDLAVHYLGISKSSLFVQLFNNYYRYDLYPDSDFLDYCCKETFRGAPVTTPHTNPGKGKHYHVQSKDDV